MAFWDDLGSGIEDLTGFNFGSNSASDRAIKAQRHATEQAIAEQSRARSQIRNDLAGYRGLGLRATHLAGGLVDDLGQGYTMQDYQQDPGYQFRLNEGMKAIERSAAARGALGSGATLKALTGYAQNMAADEYQRAFDRYQADRGNRMNILSNFLGTGLNATQFTGQAGMNAANQISGAHMGYGNAVGANAIAQANQRGSFLGDMIGLGASFLGGGGGK